ncbi:MAG: hypothetical protein M5U34_48085 [Chloroflexi bacterium]|nr:hypothetical protein [Chloroflexota bacterium]
MARYYEYVGGIYVPDFGVTVIDALDRKGAGEIIENLSTSASRPSA